LAFWRPSCLPGAASPGRGINRIFVITDKAATFSKVLAFFCRPAVKFSGRTPKVGLFFLVVKLDLFYRHERGAVYAEDQ
jgi:hypothetical protein